MQIIFKNAAGLSEVVDTQSFTTNGSKYYSFRAADGRSRTINESNPRIKRMIDLAQAPVKENV